MFVADVAAEALGDGFTREDIFAGLQYSVVRNYRSRVMGQRRLLDRVFFQGKPATDPALARTLAAVLEREVYVPADPGAMGAVGIALLAARGASTATARAGRRGHRPRAACSRRAVAGRREFQCKDRDCQQRLPPGARPRSTSLGERPQGRQRRPVPQVRRRLGGRREAAQGRAHPYREREELLAALLDEESRPAGAGCRRRPRRARPALRALPDRHAAVLPHALRRLGHDVEVLRPGPDTLAEGDRRCAAPGACAPVKLLHGLPAPTWTSSSRRSSCTCRCPTPAT